MARVAYCYEFGFDEFGFIDKTGKVITTKRYAGAENFSEGLALVNNDYLYGFIDKTGKEVIPVKFNGALSFSEDLAVVRQGECCGFIDKTGKFVFGMYVGCGPFSEGVALVMNHEDKYGYMDKTGEFIIPLTRDFYISQDIYLHTFKEDFTIVGYDKYAYMDKTGKQITPLKYHVAHPFSEGLAAVGIKNKNFEVTWDGTNNSIKLITNKSYTFVGGEVNLWGRPHWKRLVKESTSLEKKPYAQLKS
jgi:hypothetical protein